MWLYRFIRVLSVLTAPVMVFAQTVNFETKERSIIESALRTGYEGISVDSVNWSLNEDSLYEGVFQYDQRQFTTTFDRKGNWVQTAEQLHIDDLSDDFRLFLLERYNVERASDISRIERIEPRGSESYFRVTIHAREPLLFDLSGNPLDQTPHPQ